MERRPKSRGRLQGESRGKRGLRPVNSLEDKDQREKNRPFLVKRGKRNGFEYYAPKKMTTGQSKKKILEGNDVRGGGSIDKEKNHSCRSKRDTKRLYDSVGVWDGASKDDKGFNFANRESGCVLALREERERIGAAEGFKKGFFIRGDLTVSKNIKDSGADSFRRPTKSR